MGQFSTPPVIFTWVIESTQVWLSWLNQTWVNSPKKKKKKKQKKKNEKKVGEICFQTFRILQRLKKKKMMRKDFWVLQKGWKKERKNGF